MPFFARPRNAGPCAALSLSTHFAAALSAVVRSLPLACALLLPLAPAGWAASPRPAPAGFSDAVHRGVAWSVGVYLIAPGEDEPRVGAGFFIDDRGHVATAAHLLGDVEQILVALPNKQLVAAEVVGRDDVTDIAVLRVSDAPRRRPEFAPSERLRVGDWVIAVGEPFGLEHSVAAGIVSGKDRHFGDDGELVFIQSDVALNPGNSGGPLLDTTGAIVGMNARTIVGPAGSPGASLAIPIDLVLQIATELQRGTVRPRLGAQFDDVPPLAAWAAGRQDARGALILGVSAGSLAAHLQVQVGDVVTRMNDRRVDSSADLVAALLAWQRIHGTRLVVLRGGKEVVLTAE